MEREIVVVLNVTFLASNTPDLVPAFAARELRLGITAYGETRDEAKDNLVEVLKSLLTVLGEQGGFAHRLAEAGVDWRWTDEESDENGPAPDWVPDEQVRLLVAAA